MVPVRVYAARRKSPQALAKAGDASPSGHRRRVAQPSDFPITATLAVARASHAVPALVAEAADRISPALSVLTPSWHRVAATEK